MADTAYVDLEIRILKQEKGGYPVEITLNNERQFRRGYLAPRPATESWDTILDPVADGQGLFERFLADSNLKEAWGQVREQRPLGKAFWEGIRYCNPNHMGCFQQMMDGFRKKK